MIKVRWHVEDWEDAKRINKEGTDLTGDRKTSRKQECQHAKARLMSLRENTPPGFGTRAVHRGIKYCPP